MRRHVPLEVGDARIALRDVGCESTSSIR